MPTNAENQQPERETYGLADALVLAGCILAAAFIVVMCVILAFQ